MLYVTTGADREIYTAARTFQERDSASEGYFVPMHLPRLDDTQIRLLREKTFSQNMADVINLLFGTKLDGWGVEFGIGRYPVKSVPLHNKIMVAETWHNPLWKFERLASGVEKAIRQSDQISRMPSDWLMTASRAAVLFALFGHYLQSGALNHDQKIDIAVTHRNASGLMSAWYARKLGLPIGTIICCTDENSMLWSLLHKGEIRFLASDGQEVLPRGLEQLIYVTLGQKEAERFCRACKTGDPYQLDAEQLSCLREGIHVSVVSSSRMEQTIPNLYQTTGYLAAPDTARAYCGLIDYRASAGESHQALILSEESPRFSAQYISRCLHISPAELKLLFD